MKPRAIVVDCFAGGGGASVGIEQGIGRPVDVAINHDAEAIAMHTANHPNTRHLITDVHDVEPGQVAQGRPISLAWFSPDCTHFSKAKGSQPRNKNIRGLAWVVTEWARDVHPRVIMLENVEEFRTWGPLDDDGYPIPERKGETFTQWRTQLEALGYEVEFRELRACDFGAPTIRRRLFMVARCDGEPIVWPEPTHDRTGSFAFEPYRTAAECIDWSIPCPSIFERSRELAPATLRRIAYGIKRYVLEDESPFLVQRGWGERPGQTPRAMSLDVPLGTVVGQGIKQAIVTPYLAGVGGRAGQSPARPVDAPYHTTTSKADTVLVAPSIVRMNHDGQAKPADDIDGPLGTITTQHNKHQLVSALLAKNFGGHLTPGSPMTMPVSTITAKDHNSLVASSLVKLYGTSRVGASMLDPMPTVTATGQHIGEVRAFLMHYYSGGGQAQSVADPLHTITSKDRIALGVVEIGGEPYQITDIGMRMLVPRELYRAQGFPEDYIIDPEVAAGKRLTKTAQVRMVGNSVCPPAARALVAANVGSAA